MDIKIFSKIVKKLRDSHIDDFEYKCDGKIYGFKDVGDNNWDDQGKYQYKTEEGQLVELDEKYKEIQQFNYGVSRSVSRSGSYYSDYYYDNEPYTFYEIKETIVPEVIIPTHTENKWINIKIDLESIIDEEEELAKRLEVEKIKLEEEAKAEKERLTKLYPMNNPDIIKKVNKSLKKKGIVKFGIKEMRKKYFDIVVKGKLESQEWIKYHSSLQE